MVGADAVCEIVVAGAQRVGAILAHPRAPCSCAYIEGDALVRGIMHTIRILFSNPQCVAGLLLCRARDSQEPDGMEAFPEDVHIQVHAIFFYIFLHKPRSFILKKEN